MAFNPFIASNSKPHASFVLMHIELLQFSHLYSFHRSFLVQRIRTTDGLPARFALMHIEVLIQHKTLHKNLNNENPVKIYKEIA
ncbi:hypothetical protein PCORN_07190 [Listeria cornellensis FSL F6-0969]|uniref:Uncharacterized protein n=1 Tax=Listeria cornellensis FSL F6-0969 TaxID=1265820 RepID=W7CDD4_9LIST|nr:hypothetical protein PCORN_07190 [Listeria cornellensis FSL F6-0969]